MLPTSAYGFAVFAAFCVFSWSGFSAFVEISCPLLLVFPLVGICRSLRALVALLLNLRLAKFAAVSFRFPFSPTPVLPGAVEIWPKVGTSRRNLSGFI